MEEINQLERSYFLLKSGGGDYRECIEWALDRLRRDEEGDDTDIVFLAASEDRQEVLTFAEHVIERYSGYQALDEQLAAGKYLVALRHDYLRGIETVRTLESKLQSLYERLKFPGWLSVLCRNCRHAKEAKPYRDLFDKEFAYLARLWAVAMSRHQFEQRYNRAISVQHDAL
ncbi:MAG TPA: hypothetical protein VGO61_16630 [Steroidobacteraceae bacterium]|jgi:hypothetical protein|nr:hypothetical protein [Steroidobacteraceae bacterium]